MNKMTRMTEEQLKVHLDALNMKLEFSENGKPYIDGAGFHDMVSLKDQGIELINPEPEITQENLSRFYLVYKEFPEAEFTDVEGDAPQRGLLAILCTQSLQYGTHDGDWFESVLITDSRWSDLEDKWKEYVKGVG